MTDLLARNRKTSSSENCKKSKITIDGSTDRRCFAIVTNERAILSGSDQPVRKVRQTPYYVFQAGKQMVWCIVNTGNGYELNNNKGKTD